MHQKHLYGHNYFVSYIFCCCSMFILKNLINSQIKFIIKMNCEKFRMVWSANKKQSLELVFFALCLVWYWEFCRKNVVYLYKNSNKSWYDWVEKSYKRWLFFGFKNLHCSFRYCNKQNIWFFFKQFFFAIIWNDIKIKLIIFFAHFTMC